MDSATGAITSRIHTQNLPDGVIYKACGNRRATVCPACSTIYRKDAFQLLRAGLIGGKTVPTSVSTHPAVFATFTAPSFGPVHTRHIRTHTCTNKAHCSCRPEPCHARRNATMCEHGYLTACFGRHKTNDASLGHPLCLDCYDHDHQVIWNFFSGELWRRTKQAIERHLNRFARTLGIQEQLRVSHGKAAEFQVRGAIHFHALLRLDAIDPADKSKILPPPPDITAADLEAAIRYATATATFTTPGHPEQLPGWPITWGQQLDIRPITLSGDGSVTESMVASYLAKYSTKATETTGHSSRRLDDESIDLYADPDGTHTQRLIAACWHLGHIPAWQGLRRWAHMLGFGGHFLTKARRYSVTFGQLRTARISYRRTESTSAEYTALDAIDPIGDDTTLIIGNLTYAGSGWRTTGDALANTAATQARERIQAGKEELRREIAPTFEERMTSE
jgi:hypothetical protein